MKNNFVGSYGIYLLRIDDIKFIMPFWRIDSKFYS